MKFLSELTKVLAKETTTPVVESHRSESQDPRTADKLEVGDTVEIANGDTKFDGDTGEIERFGQDKKFVVVKLFKGGSHSFHSSDVIAYESDDEEEKEAETFYVAFYDEDEHRSWIGEVSKENGGKWHESSYKGKPDSRWGMSYMSYLSPQDVMSWIYKDYGRGMDIEGPFMEPEEAEEHVKHNWGGLKESAFKVNHAKSTLDNFESFADCKIKNGRCVIKGLPVNIDEDSDEDNIGFSAVDQGAGTDLMKLLRAAGFAVKRFDDKEFMVTLKQQTNEGVTSGQTLDITIAELKSVVKEIMTDLVDDYKEHAKKGQTSVPSAPNTSSFRAIKYGMIEVAPKTSVGGSVYDLFLKIGSNVDRKIEKEIEEQFEEALSAEGIKIQKNKWYETSDGYQVRYGDEGGSAWTGFGFIIKQVSVKAVKEEAFTDFDDWKQAVLNSYPQQAKKIKFKGRMEGDKDTISAEIPGEDRCFGVWDQDKEKGVVLSEAIKSSELKKAQAYFNRNADADMDYEDIIDMLTSEDFSEEIANEVALNAGRVPAGKRRSAAKVTEGVTEIFKKVKEFLLKPVISQEETKKYTDAVETLKLIKSDSQFKKYFDKDPIGAIKSVWKWSDISSADKKHVISGNTIDSQLNVKEGFAMDDIAIGGSVIYKTLKGDIKMSTCRGKGPGLMVKLQNGDTIQNAAVLSTDASDWSEYKDYGKIKEAKSTVKSAWKTWYPEDYESDDDDFYEDLSAAILSYVKEKFGGAAWFKGGDYAYEVNVATPTALTASDGSPIKCVNVARGLQDYCNKGILVDFAESDPKHWDEFFRPIAKKTPMAKDGAPKYGSEQERHELGEDVHTKAVEWFKATKPTECEKCKSPDFYRTSFGHTQKIVCAKCGAVAARKEIKEDAIAEMWGDSDHAPDKMSKKDEASRVAKLKARNTNGTQTGLDWPIDGVEKLIADGTWKTLDKVAVDKNITIDNGKRKILIHVVPPYAKTGKISNYPKSNDSALGMKYDSRFNEDVDAIIKEHGGFPRKGSIAYNIAMKRKEEESKPENIKKTEKVGTKNHMVGTAKVTVDEAHYTANFPHEIQWCKNKIAELEKQLEKKPSTIKQINDLKRQIKEKELAMTFTEGKAENIAKLRQDYKDAKGWIEMSKSDHERRGYQKTVQKIWNHAKNQYKIDLDRKDGKLDEEGPTYKMELDAGDKVKHPTHGVGKVVGKLSTGSLKIRFDNSPEISVHKRADVKHITEAPDRTTPEYHHAQANRLHAELGVNGYDSHLADKLEKHKSEYKKLTGQDVDLSKTSKKWGIREARLPQLSPGGADYSGYDTEHLKSLLKPGIMHRDELKFKTLIRRELKKREDGGHTSVLGKALNKELSKEKLASPAQKKKNQERFAATDAKKVAEGFSPYKPGARVKIISGPKDVVGKIGTIGEVQKSGNKYITVDYDHDDKSTKPNFGAKSVQLQSKDIKLVKA